MRKTKEFFISKGEEEVASFLDNELRLSVNTASLIGPGQYSAHKVYQALGLPDSDQSGLEVWRNARSEARIGKIVNKLVPGKFNQAQIEEFVNKFRAIASGKTQTIRLVSGDEIAKWYDLRNYMSMTSTLGSSCMADKPASFFEIYTKNPEVCSLLCVFDLNSSGEEKLVGRALVWKVQVADQQSTTFMDRQYTISDRLVAVMKMWADEKGWAWRTHNSIENPDQVTFGGQKLKCDMVVNLENLPTQHYPYMDTFKNLELVRGQSRDPDTKTLHNHSNEVPGNLLMTLTTGGFRLVPPLAPPR